MRSMLFRTATIVALIAATGVLPPAQAQTTAQVQALQGVDYWTEPSGASIFRDTLPTQESGRAIALDAAINEEESAQVVLRSAAAFSINSVTFTALTAGAQQIAAGNLSYNFVTYKTLNKNTPNIYPLLRKAPGEFPDPLSNARSIDVAARSSQSIWLTVAVPKGTTAGLYSGSATVSTTKGDLQVPVSVDVRGVTVPDSKDGAFSTSLWNTFTGELSWAPDGPTIERTYGYERYSDQYFAMMEKTAAMMRRHHTNTVTLPLVNLLVDGNTTVTDNANGTGTYSFDWSRIDQMVEFYDSRGVMKKLEGFWVSADTNNYGHPADGIRDIEIVDRPSGSGKGQRSYANWDTPKARNFMAQFIPALKAHVEAKGWAGKYWMHVGDEPSSSQGEEDWKGIAARLRQYWPGVKIGDAVFLEPFASHVAAETDVVIPCIPTYDANRTTYDNLRAQGKDLYLYNCNIPVGNYLNRFIDQPQFDQRLTGWYAYSRGANGYLHYSMNGWLASLDADPPKGDHYIIWPDVANNSIESSVRYESLRDGIEDYEVLNILGKTNPGLAKDLATSLTQTADKYSPDTGYQARIRRLVLDAAAGKPVVAGDLALGSTATASTWTPGSEPGKAVDGNGSTGWRPSGTGEQWLQIDLGKQVQLDGVRLNWASTPPASYFDLKKSPRGGG